MIKHKGCGGHFEQYVIREHGYCFMQCSKCRHRLGGERVNAKIKKLMATKVWPTVRRV